MTTPPSPPHVLNLPRTGTMADALRAAIREADEIAVSVSFVLMSGLQLLLPALATARLRGATVRILTSTYMTTTEPQALRALLHLSGITLRVQSGEAGFHAKAHLFVRGATKVAWVGSTNWSRGGLRDNVEWNTRIDDPHAFDEAWSHFEALWARPDVRTPDDLFLAAYSAQWKAAQRRALATPVTQVADGASAYGAAPTPTVIQREALQRLKAQRDEGVRRALVVAATGVGKTLLAAFDAQAMGATRILFVAHRKDIVQQAARAFAWVFGGAFACDVLTDGAQPTGKPAVFVTIQALFAKAGASLLAASWDYAVIDEFHHAEAEGWKRVLHTLKATFLLGLTATPERADGRNVMDLCDGNVAYEVRLPEAIRQRALVPFHYFGIADETVDYGALPKHPSDDELGAALSVTTRAELVLKHAVEKGYDGLKRVAVGFCAGVAHAEFMAAEFTKRGEVAAVVHGGTETDARRAIYDRLADGDDPLSWLFVADVLNEGVDIPAINTVLFLRPTESPVVFLQQLGRGLRKHPGTEVLTVIDLVGHHRASFEALHALHDEQGVPTPESHRIARALQTAITPPEGCEFLLEDRTIEMLERVRRIALSRRDRVEAAYRQLRTDLGRAPEPLDGMRVAELSLANVRASHTSWRALRIALNDAAPWERAVADGDATDRLLSLAERNFQEQRVERYAALWASLDDDLAASYARFFVEHPRWESERVARSVDDLRAAVAGLLEKAKCADLYGPAGWAMPVSDALREAVRARLRATLEGDYQLRHGGVLRAPHELVRFAAYARQAVMHHFGTQYDPTRHNRGVIEARAHEGHWILLARVDTSHAKAEHQYENRVLDRSTVRWSSQNQMTADNKAGEIITKQKERGVRLHLFVAPGSHAPYRYLGEVTVKHHEGSGPMRVTFTLPEPMPDAVFDELTAGAPDEA